MKEIRLIKDRTYEDGSKFSFRYAGISSKDYNEEETERLIEAFLNKKSLHSDMLINVSHIRTILRKAEEKILIIEYTDKHIDEVVKYDKGVLYNFTSKKYEIESDNYLKIEYEPGRKLTFSFSDFEEQKIMEPQQITIIKEKSAKGIDYIESLSKAEVVSLDNEAKMIIEIYRLFYGENPDFTKEDINIKFQTMLSILAQFNGYFDVYNFNLTENMPESQELLQIVNKLFPVSIEEIDFNESPIEFSPNKKEIIKIVGEAIRKSIDKETDINEALITISRIIFENRYNKEKEYDIEELAKNTGYPQNEIDTNVKLINAIQSKLAESKN